MQIVVTITSVINVNEKYFIKNKIFSYYLRTKKFYELITDLLTHKEIYRDIGY